MKHTRGPWVAVQYANYFALQIEKSYSITDDLLNEDTNPNAEANAKLAAAAPELLAFAESVAKGQDQETMPTFIARIRRQAKEIIEKATK